MKIGIMDQAVSTGGGGGGGLFPELLNFTDSDDNILSGGVMQMEYPTGIGAGDLLLAFLVGEDASDEPTSTASGWTRLNGNVHYKVAAGSESGPINFPCGAGSSSNSMIGTMCRVPAAKHTAGTPPESSAETAVTSTSVDPPLFSPSMGAGNNLWISFFYVRGAMRNVTARPSGYSLYQHDYQPLGEQQLDLVAKEGTAATENPGAWTVSSSGNLCTRTLVVRGT